MHKYSVSELGLSILIGVTYYLLSFTDATFVDYSYCRSYTPEADGVTSDIDGRNITFMGHTWDTNYFILHDIYADFYESANAACKKLNLEIASINTDCEYGVLDRWFKTRYPTTYSVWLGAVRFGNGDEALWYPSREEADFSAYGFRYLSGPYPPGGYNSINHPWVNCVAVNRNCPLYTSGPTNPCTQTATYPDLQFTYADCRIKNRVICQEPCYMP